MSQGATADSLSSIFSHDFGRVLVTVETGNDGQTGCESENELFVGFHCSLNEVILRIYRSTVLLISKMREKK